jgi:hypothetical protein
VAIVPKARLLFGSELLPELLELVLNAPRRRFSWTDLNSALAAPNPESLYRALNRAVELGVVRRESKGRYGIYSANTSSPLYGDLKRTLSRLAVRRAVGSYQPLKLTDVAAQLKRIGLRDDLKLPDEVSRWIYQFIDDFRASRRAAKRELIANEPEHTGSLRLDAYLAAVAEYLSNEASLPAPEWVENADRFLKRWWIESDVPSARPTAVAQSPAAFRRRGIFIAERALERV